MGGMIPFGGKSAPEAPDFAGAAERQAGSSREAIDRQTRANRPNQRNAWGASTRWSQNADGSWSQSQDFGGPMGEIAGNWQQQALDASGSPVGTGDEARQKAIDATYSQSASRLDPLWAQREEAQRAQLRNQGLDPGTEAYNAEMGRTGRERTDAYQSALRDAISTGDRAQALTFGQNLAAKQFPMQQLGALRGFTEMPGFMGAGAAQPTQYLPAAMAGYQGALQQYGIDQETKNSKMQGAVSAGTTAAAASDERLKTNIERLHFEALPGVPLATWEWRDRPGVKALGVIAQDVEKVRPDLVTLDENGFRFVDYAGLFAGNTLALGPVEWQPAGHNAGAR